MLRRVDSDAASDVLRARDLLIDIAGHRAKRDDMELDLSSTEFKLLVELARHAGQVLTRDVLLERVWNTEYMGDSRLVDMAVKRLRDKLEDGTSDSPYITTVRGAGYRFERELTRWSRRRAGSVSD